MGQTVQEALNRQLGHYAYHVGQIVFIGKTLKNKNWKSLSIPYGKSEEYNSNKFSKPKRTSHFTEALNILYNYANSAKNISCRSRLIITTSKSINSNIVVIN